MDDDEDDDGDDFDQYEEDYEDYPPPPIRQRTTDEEQFDREGSSDEEEEQKKRKELHNQLEDMKGAIRLFCRIRPLSNTELEREESKHNVISILDEFTVTFTGKS
jgi:hypothetical protein